MKLCQKILLINFVYAFIKRSSMVMTKSGRISKPPDEFEPPIDLRQIMNNHRKFPKTSVMYNEEIIPIDLLRLL